MSFENKISICKGCSQEKLIVNKTHKLCTDCNRKRLDTNSGGRQKERKQLLAKTTFKASQIPLKTNKKMNQKSSKQKKIDSAYSETLKILAKREYICTGCGATDGLTPSHLVPRGVRRDLVAVARNVTWHCLTCHPIWESPRRMELNDYVENMEIVRRLDEKYYNLLIMKQDEYYNGKAKR